MAHERKLSIRKIFAIILINIFGVLILFFIIEGFSSTLIFIKFAFFGDLLAERRHTQYDEKLGWINSPNLSIEDMYGGKSFITNSMAFRNNKEFSLRVPRNKVRVICSGDSFTMGYGVGNNDVWCKLLESINDRIETVNLGQGGYGIDQAYLWYKRNQSELDHNIQIFAFITGDFYRMQSDTFHGYGKPFLVLQDGVLTNKNKLVPKRTYSFPRLPKVIQELHRLKSIKILNYILFPKDSSISLEKNNQTRKIIIKIFQNLQEINRAKNSTPVFVYLPTKKDYMNKNSEVWRHFLHAEAKKHDFLFIDLINEFRKYPPQEVETLFNGHYSEKGNSYIANIMYEKLLSFPEVANKFKEN